MTAPNSRERILPRLIEEEMQQSFINYSMSVIVSRALPDVRDGLKPVHRRILYAMNELGLVPGRPYKKSATVVGDVLGKYHPHGDSVGVRRAGAHGPGLLAALSAGRRAGELRLGGRRPARRPTATPRPGSPVSRSRCWRTSTRTRSTSSPTSTTGSRSRPSSRRKIPNLLVNGSSGIAVGMATNIPPHNLREVAKAVELLVDNPEATIADLRKAIKGPDFPTGALHLRPGGHQGGLRDRPRPRGHARPGPDRGEGVVRAAPRSW